MSRSEARCTQTRVRKMVVTLIQRQPSEGCDQQRGHEPEIRRNRLISKPPKQATAAQGEQKSQAQRTRKSPSAIAIAQGIALGAPPGQTQKPRSQGARIATIMPSTLGTRTVRGRVRQRST